MIKFKVGKIKYNKKNFHPYRVIKFKLTPEMANDLKSHSTMDTKEIMMKDFENLLYRLEKYNSRHAYNDW